MPQNAKQPTLVDEMMDIYKTFLKELQKITHDYRTETEEIIESAEGEYQDKLRKEIGEA